MTKDDFENAPWGLETASRTMFDDVPCVDGCSWVSAICPPGTSGYFTETVPTVHSRATGVFALEDRSKTSSWAHRYRRIYNLFLALVQHKGLSMSELREKLFYVVLQPERTAEGSSFSSDLIELSDGLSTVAEGASGSSAVEDVWEFEPTDHEVNKREEDERRLSGFLCKKAYLIYPHEMAAFAAKKGMF